MAKTKILQMVTGNRIWFEGVLYRRDDRAYKVTKKHGLDLLALDEGDLPIFRETKKSNLAEDTHIIDLTGGAVEEGEDVVRKEVGGKVISKEPATGKSKKDLKATAKKKIKNIATTAKTETKSTDSIEV